MAGQSYHQYASAHIQKRFHCAPWIGQSISVIRGWIDRPSSEWWPVQKVMLNDNTPLINTGLLPSPNIYARHHLWHSYKRKAPININKLSQGPVKHSSWPVETYNRLAHTLYSDFTYHPNRAREGDRSNCSVRSSGGIWDSSMCSLQNNTNQCCNSRKS